MERREFLKVAFGFAAGAAALASAASAAPLMPPPDALNAKGLNGKGLPDDLEAKPALADQRDLDDARVEEVRWGRRRGWGRRRWGFRRRRFWGFRRRRFWGVRRRHWRRRWHRRYW